jgi:hypothetical protein
MKEIQNYGTFLIKYIHGSRTTNVSVPKPSQAKVLTEGGDWREAQVDVALFVSHSCV